jgi:hypothetical protein
MNIEERVVGTILLWVAIVGVNVLRHWVYRIRTRGWVPLSSDTAWMVDRGHRLEFPPSPLPLVIAGVVATLFVWWI